jgi:uncharacterized membrane protein
VNTKKIAVIAVLTALSIGTNYAMISLSNVKLMDLIVFVGGFCFGPFAGALIGILSWAVYGSINPIGFSLPIWLSTMLSESIYGIAGAFVRKGLGQNGIDGFGHRRINVSVFFGILGMLLTIVYDTLTNIVFGYVSGWNILVAVIFGFVPLGLVHLVSNAFFFGLGCFPTVSAILRVVGGEEFDVSKR